MIGFEDIVLGLAIVIPYTYIHTLFYSYFGQMGLRDCPKILFSLALGELLISIAILIDSYYLHNMDYLMIAFCAIVFGHILHLRLVMELSLKLTVAQEIQVFCYIITMLGIIFGEKLLILPIILLFSIEVVHFIMHYYSF